MEQVKIRGCITDFHPRSSKGGFYEVKIEMQVDVAKGSVILRNLQHMADIDIDFEEGQQELISDDGQQEELDTEGDDGVRDARPGGAL